MVLLDGSIEGRQWNPAANDGEAGSLTFEQSAWTEGVSPLFSSTVPWRRRPDGVRNPRGRRASAVNGLELMDRCGNGAGIRSISFKEQRGAVGPD